MHGEHVAEPHESTSTPAWCLRGESIFGLASDGPTSIVGPGELFGVATQRPQGHPPFIRRFSEIFFCVGLCSLYFLFVGHVASRYVSDEIAWIYAH